MHVLQLWRYPIKSMQGEQLSIARVGAYGIKGDRSWALVDNETGLTLTARRVPELLFGTGLLIDGQAVVRLPDGTETTDDAALSQWLQREVTLVSVSGQPATYEIAADFENESGSKWHQWQGPADTFHDSTRTRVSIIGEDTIGDWSVRRFRANIVVSGGSEDGLVGTQVTVGSDAVLDVVKQIDRCVMVTRPQPGGIERDLNVLRAVNATRGSMLGVAALVLQSGDIVVGDGLQHRT